MHLMQLRRLGQTQIHHTRLILMRLHRLSTRQRINSSVLWPVCCVLMVMVIVWELVSIRTFFETNRYDSSLIIHARAVDLSVKLDPRLYPGLFGLYVADDIAQVDVKGSSLAVTVIGIGYAENPSDSVVILRLADGQDHRFHIGDLLPFGARIRRINRTEVFIERANMLEKLILNKE